QLGKACDLLIVHTAEPQHDPSRTLTELVKLRDQKCAGPGCSMPASRCDLDHHTPWPQGPTAEWNLKDNSRRCHQAKHHGWTQQLHPDGSSTWTSPTGSTYDTPSFWQPPPPIPNHPQLPDLEQDEGREETEE
ncbi:MAG: HNH endonuclease signature motif containing protein, partial [Mycobacteriales bacterium]